MFNNFFAKQLLARQLKNIPPEQQEKVIEMVTQNPEFFKKIAESVQARMKKGEGQMEATMATLKENESELRKMFGQE